MDTKLIKQFGTDILCYRIRTARQKKRMQYEDFDKQLIALNKEQEPLYINRHTPAIDKNKKIDPEKESRLDEIENYIRGNNYDKRLYRMIHGHYQHKTWGMPAKENPFKNKSFYDTIDLMKEEVF
jgi:hypothetical protein